MVVIVVVIHLKLEWPSTDFTGPNASINDGKTTFGTVNEVGCTNDGKITACSKLTAIAELHQ